MSHLKISQSCPRFLTLIFVFSLTFVFSLHPAVGAVSSLAVENATAGFAVNLPAILSNSSGDLEGQRLPTQVCKGSLLGTNLNRESCMRAFRSIPYTKGIRVFGDPAFGPYEISLPRRYISVGDVEDGVCAIDIFHRDGYFRDVASFRQISQAADKLLAICLPSRGSGRPNEGGYIRDLGQNKNLVVVLSVYEPHVACYGPSELFKGAGQDLLSMIPTSTESQIFGPEGEPGVEVVVPKKFAIPRVVPQFGTQAVVNVENRDRVTGRWIDLWAGAVAVNAMCVAQGRAGTSSLPGGLSMTLKKLYGGLESNHTAIS